MVKLGNDLGGEQGLARLRWLLDSIVENVPAMIFVKEARELRFELFNRAGEELLGTSRAELLGKNDYDLFPEEQASFFQRRDRETLESRQVVDVPEEPIETPSGRRWLHTRKVPILDERGVPAFLLGISLDVTEHREAQQALRRSHEELESEVRRRTEELRAAQEELLQAAKMEALGRLAGGIAHDFNNMLMVILGHVNLLVSSPGLDASTRSGLEEVQAAAERGTSLTRQLLAVSRRQSMEARALGLNDTVRRIEGMLARLIGENIELRAELAAEPDWIRADPSVVEQTIVNLAVNARDAMPQGGTLTIATESDEKGVALVVADTGCGMDERTRARIFDPFFTTKPEGEGTGLGLASVHGAVTQSGGRITVRSRAGAGTEFRVLLPPAESPPAAEEPAPPAHGFEHGHETILLVEDESHVRRVARKMLENASYRVIEAGSPEEALRILQGDPSRIELLLTDVFMPGLSGPELAERSRRMRPELPVLYMSGYLPPDLGGPLRPEGPLLRKPFKAASLARAVRRALAGAPDAAE